MCKPTGTSSRNAFSFLSIRNWLKTIFFIFCHCYLFLHMADTSSSQYKLFPLFNDTWRRYHSLTVLFPLFCCCLVGICWSYICCWASHVFVFDLPLGEVLCAIGKRDIQEMPSRCFSKGIIFSQMPKKGKEINRSLWELDMEKKRKKQGRKPACFFFKCFFLLFISYSFFVLFCFFFTFFLYLFFFRTKKMSGWRFTSIDTSLSF